MVTRDQLLAAIREHGAARAIADSLGVDLHLIRRPLRELLDGGEVFLVGGSSYCARYGLTREEAACRYAEARQAEAGREGRNFRGNRSVRPGAVVLRPVARLPRADLRRLDALAGRLHTTRKAIVVEALQWWLGQSEATLDAGQPRAGDAKIAVRISDTSLLERLEARVTGCRTRALGLVVAAYVALFSSEAARGPSAAADGA